MTQEELAEELTKRKLEREKKLYSDGKIVKIDDLPITRQTVSKYENATISMNQDILFDVASIFQKSINDFFPPINNKNAKLQHSKIINVNDDIELEIRTEKPFESYTKDEQDLIIMNVMKKYNENQ